ncbi:bifunctional proline dehydrogenase/L-glutamate gamma-semialdehyde dehydrogenase [Pacificitalea manganoxidans]|uniref:Bifunctional protein PutA n=1 Tax=Pacificitalea manganoxidans TaxID=1411902 RepID=A0A291LW37_9RHOB|nr:bifunctional proline dehydrogenase/L-glutamate gamma-semialdehyde dehydrogenase PutA [Pacificitalea manganoxidans]ATI40920.1 bifunctional proline dehydrogenase/L-glutamate gamma-semialdehyde dehydrogenase [Pacificitalea manganoxidans]MDR6308266.1 RHH-type proline utilization regulon transcriptional repressor/proline dehydrogenase/delta 1-pyrroline-5-carboxylate dehydrogenase [Pacificitalea manganoxidans]
MTAPLPLTRIEAAKHAPEAPLLETLIAQANLSPADRAAIHAEATDLVKKVRADARPGLMEVFLAEYGLSTEEGIALMCLAEALLRVPDAETIDDLIEDKIAPSDWGKHLGHSASSLVNASTWALMLTGKVLDDRRSPGIASHLRGAVKRLGEPVIRTAVGRAMKEMGRQFVLGETIEGALDRAAKMEAKGYTYSYDMLGEAAMTARDARRYYDAYAGAIDAIAKRCKGQDIRRNPGISVKLSALHPRYEVAKEARVLEELVPILTDLCRKAKAAGMGLNIDAEEADRLVISLKVIEAALANPSLAGWDGFGVVVQAYGRRAALTLDWLHALAERHDRRITVRLVKGAYWDTEIKHAQVEGLEDFPVFTRKAATDVSYIANARKLLQMTDRIYPQFATHNAHTVAAVLHMARDAAPGSYEFQRLHGMGERLHQIVHDAEGTGCRIYAPVGAHRDLLAYLVRRLLENGANSSFVNQIVDEEVAPETVAADPFTALGTPEANRNAMLAPGPEIFGPGRRNSMGFDLTDGPTLARIDAARAGVTVPDAAPRLAGDAGPGTGGTVTVHNPATGAVVAQVQEASAKDVARALDHAAPWQVPAAERAQVLRRAADLYERDFGPLFALLAQEAGKSLPDAVGELREAVDFLRYYANGGEALSRPARGIFACISPWNFPLAIFTGQISAALAAGNGVLAKPAEQTALVADHAVRLLHEAGVPRSALQLLPGRGDVVGAAIAGDGRVSGVAFTGSTDTALRIRRSMAYALAPGAPLIAETGGLNAMIVDSTALPEQAIRDIVASAFQSAGQRCSALRCLYVQEDVADTLLEMLQGAMDELRLGDPWHLSTDVGPVIDAEAKAGIDAHIATARTEGRLIKQLETPADGTFVGPALIRIGGIADLEQEIFGPVLHVATFKARELEQVIAAINATGYGLTFGLHTRIDGRVQDIADRIEVGNAYVNRNQIGAIVGSQPFGGEGLSGTGPKAGGPNYLTRYTAPEPGHPVTAPVTHPDTTAQADPAALQRALDAAPREQVLRVTDLPGPTGESNRLRLVSRASLLCMGPGAEAARAQADAVEALGGHAVIAEGTVTPDTLRGLTGLSAVLFWGSETDARPLAQALAQRDGPILPLITGRPDAGHVAHERHLCVDTTAAGGNADLLAGMERD